MSWVETFVGRKQENLMWNYLDYKQPHHTTTILRPFFQDHPGELVREEHLWTLWRKGRSTVTDTPTIRLGATPSRSTSAHLHHPPVFTGQMPFMPPNRVKELKATSAFGLGRRRNSYPQRCYMYRLRTSIALHNTIQSMHVKSQWPVGKDDCHIYDKPMNCELPSVLWHCWLRITKSIWPKKIWVMRCWQGFLTAARCKWFAYVPADANATQSSLA